MLDSFLNLFLDQCALCIGLELNWNFRTLPQEHHVRLEEFNFVVDVFNDKWFVDTLEFFLIRRKTLERPFVKNTSNGIMLDLCCRSVIVPMSFDSLSCSTLVIPGKFGEQFVHTMLMIAHVREETTNGLGERLAADDDLLGDRQVLDVAYGGAV